MDSFQANSSFQQVPSAVSGGRTIAETTNFLAANRRVRGSASDGKETVPIVFQLAPEDYPRYEQLRL